MSHFISVTVDEELLFVISALKGIFKARAVTSRGQLPGRKGQIPPRSAEELPVDSQGLHIRPGASDVPQSTAVMCVLKSKGACGQPALFGAPELSDQTCHKALWHCLVELLPSRLLSLIALDLQSVTFQGDKFRNSSDSRRSFQC